MQRAKTQMGSTRESLSVLREAINKPDVLPTRLSLHTQERIIVAEIDQIVRCEADGNNTRFVLVSGEKIFVTNLNSSITAGKPGLYHQSTSSFSLCRGFEKKGRRVFAVEKRGYGGGIGQEKGRGDGAVGRVMGHWV